MKRSGFSLGIMALVICGLGAAAWATDGITVEGTGEAKGKPTEVQITGTLTGEAELATDATVKFRDAKKRALAAIGAIKNADLSVQPQGVVVAGTLDANAQQMMMRGQPVQSPNQKVLVREVNKIILANADKMEPDALLDTILKVVDAAKDAGFQLTKPPMNNYNYYEMQEQAQQGFPLVTFKLADTDALRDQAYKAAIDDAKSRAQKIADLSGVKLGRILSVTEGERIEGPIYPGMPRNDMPKEVTGSSSGDLKLKVTVTVLFDIAK